LHEPAVRQGKDLVKKLLLRWQGQPHSARREPHLGKHHLQQLLREKLAECLPFPMTSPSHSPSLSASCASGTFCVRADIFVFKIMDVVLKGKKGNPLFKISFIV